MTDYNVRGWGKGRPTQEWRGEPHSNQQNQPMWHKGGGHQVHSHMGTHLFVERCRDMVQRVSNIGHKGNDVGGADHTPQLAPHLGRRQRSSTPHDTAQQVKHTHTARGHEATQVAAPKGPL
jgi:hypothetical protein